MIGTILRDRYEILEKIGEGGMSFVYRARDLQEQKTVAVKVLRPEHVSDEDFIRRFRREAEATKRLKHPHLVELFDISIEEEPFFLVMECVTGPTLHQVIAEEELDFDRVVYLALQITEALQFAHKNHIIHRDIKPQNILVSEDDFVKVTDFGIAVLVSTTTLVNTRSVIGSVHYFSPEQARGETATEQSDLYSLGIVLYEMIAGQVPFEGDSPVAIALKQVQEEPWPLSDLRSDVPSSLEAVVMRLLEKDLRLRYQSATDLLRDLRAVADEIQQRTGSTLLEKIMHTFGSAEQKNIHEQRRQRQMQRWLVTFLLLGCLAVGLVFGFWQYFLSQRGEEAVIDNYVGWQLEEAAAALTELGFSYHVSSYIYDANMAPGTVTWQSAQAGPKIRLDRVIEFAVCAGVEYFEVPQFIGMDEREAKVLSDAKGLKVQTKGESSPSEPEGRVIAQLPDVGSQVYRGMDVTLTVSSGPEKVVVPDVKGRTLEEASQLLQEAELLPGNITVRTVLSELPNAIIEQSPAAGDLVAKNTRIALVRNSSQTVINYTVHPKADGPAVQSIRIEIEDSTKNNPQRSFDATVSKSKGFEDLVIPAEAPATVHIYLEGELLETITR